MCTLNVESGRVDVSSIVRAAEGHTDFKTLLTRLRASSGLGGAVDLFSWMRGMLQPKGDAAMLKRVLGSTAYCLEQLLPQWERDPLLGASVTFNRMGDAELRQHIADNLVHNKSVRSAFKVGPLAKALGEKLTSHRTADDEFAGYRLLLATRRLMHECWHLAVSPDGGRASGKHRLVAPLVNPAVEFACWGPTQVTGFGGYFAGRPRWLEPPPRASEPESEPSSELASELFLLRIGTFAFAHRNLHRFLVFRVGHS